ncbi:MAG: DSD1 family PLP-dependent enzyme [Oscillospiraceae bacterium]|nr:DSD1 family PLP-dependent enzyme [Oscillospiraceae bacterium]
MKVSQIETPALIVERSAFENNMAAMNRLLEQTTMAFRPHYKSHKSIDVVKRQLAAGAKGITCAKLSEAEDLAQAGVGDILIANQVVQQEKLGRVAVLANKTRLTICVDDARQVAALERAVAAQGGTLYVLVEYEIGMARCGVETHEEVIHLAKLIREQPHLSFEGIQAYAGHLSHEVDLEVRKSASAAIEADLTRLKKKLEEAGLPPKEISGGSTGSVELKPRDSVYTEMQCGSYLFMDGSYAQLDLRFENSLFLLTTVISTKPDRVVTDGGMKSLGMDQGAPIFVGYEGLPVKMSEEHGQVTAPGHKAEMGDKLRYIPGHCCTTINMHDKLYLVDGEEVVDIWPVTSRGKSQ